MKLLFNFLVLAWLKQRLEGDIKRKIKKKIMIVLNSEIIFKQKIKCKIMQIEKSRIVCLITQNIVFMPASLKFG